MSLVSISSLNSFFFCFILLFKFAHLNLQRQQGLLLCVEIFFFECMKWLFVGRTDMIQKIQSKVLLT